MPKHALSYRVQAKILFRKEEEDFASILNLILFVKKKKKCPQHIAV